MTKIFAFDPGQTTGYAVIEVTPDGKDFTLYRCDEIPWHVRIPNVHDVLCESSANDLVVYETFRLFPHKAAAQIGSQFPSAQVIGVIETAAFYAAIPMEQIRTQEPGDIQRVQVLQRDLDRVAGSPHKIDAYRHARLFFLKHFYMNPFATK